VKCLYLANYMRQKEWEPQILFVIFSGLAHGIVPLVLGSPSHG